MDFHLPLELAAHYHSNSQKSRILTESWLSAQVFCPVCGATNLYKFENNRPVADFYCQECSSEFELKSKNGSIAKKVADGAYETMIQRITSNLTPHFFFLEYSSHDWQVHNLTFVPSHFFIPEIIERRNPLPSSARRAGWVGCSILYHQIPKSGRIKLIDQQNIRDKALILQDVRRISFLANRSLDARGWLASILNCIDHLPSTEFTLAQVYQFLPYLEEQYPNNHNIKAKIRQQLQILRDQNLLRFCGKGVYEKLY